MVSTSASPSSSADPDPFSSSANIVDGLTPENGGGREEGDVELALFRRIRSFSNVSMPRPSFSPAWGYQRYFQHPLSMFSSDIPDSAESDPSETPAVGSSNNEPDENTDANVINDDSNNVNSNKQPVNSSLLHSRSKASPSSSTSPQPSSAHSSSSSAAWRDALVQACASMLGKTLDELRADYNDVISASTPSATTFASQSSTFEPIPRDLADYAIITTLKQQDPSTMQNASSWLFNMMDRTGAGFVLRDEFIRYAPFIGPISDFAVAGIVFDELVREQVRAATEAAAASANERARQQKRNDNNQQKEKDRHQQYDRLRNKHNKNMSDSTHDGLRQRKNPTHPLEPNPNERTPLNLNYNSNNNKGKDSFSSDVFKTSSSSSDARTSIETRPSPGSDLPTIDMFPPSAALHFDMWRVFFQAIQDKYHYVDEDWVRVKREIGIDPEETLIKSQGALDHSDLFPTLGKLYLSQRYLIFFAAVGRNHYVVRLGAIAEVSTDAIPLMMRDCVRIRLESEAKVAMDGVSAVVNESVPSKTDGTNEKNSGGGGGGGEQEEEQVSQYIGKLMRQYMGGRKPLLFSLLEFRETKRRDNWVHLIREMASAYKLHAQLGFGSAGRAVRDIHKRNGKGAGSGLSDDDEDDDGSGASGADGGNASGNKQNKGGKNGEDRKKVEKRRKNFSLNYSRSPFRSEPSPPLLAVAAHSNIVRYRALRRVTQKRVSRALLVFSDEERNPALVNWYTDSVRAYQSQSGRTWIERALTAIRENMDTNDRMYRVQDDEPFDIGKLGDEIGRFAELCAPFARVMQFFDHLIQWRNPPATILAILVCLFIAYNGYVHYVPAFMVLLQALWVVETKFNMLGMGMGGAATEDAEQRQRNVLQLVAQVHDTLAAGQNVLARSNRELGKVQTLFLWSCDDDRDSWISVGSLCLVSLVLLVVPARTIFLALMFFLFFKHFLPPSNPGLRFWQTIPSRIDVRRKQRNGRLAISRRASTGPPTTGPGR